MPPSSPMIDQYVSVMQWYRAASEAGTVEQTRWAPDTNAVVSYAAKAAALLSRIAHGSDAARSEARGRSHLARRLVVASDPSAVTATATERARAAEYGIRVETLASAQVNAGTPLRASATGGIPAGVHEFAVAVGMRSVHVSVDVAAHESNETVLKHIRDAIRAADAQVHASVVKSRIAENHRAPGSPGAEIVQLQLTARGTGSDYAFAVTDVAGSAAYDTGIGSMKEPPVDAIYRVNGGEWLASSSNAILLDNGNVIAALHRPTADVVRLKVGPDTETIFNVLQNIVAAYNELHAGIAAAGSLIDPWIRHAVESVVQERLEALAGIGVAPGADGALSLSEEAWRRALSLRFEEGQRTMRDFAKHLEETAVRFAQTPTAALLHSDLRFSYLGYPLYTASGGAYPSWSGVSGLRLNVSY